MAAFHMDLADAVLVRVAEAREFHGFLLLINEIFGYPTKIGRFSILPD